MLTEKVILMRNDFNENGITKKQSREMIDELIDNCKPTVQEMKLMFDGCIVDGYVLYRLAVDGQKLKENK